MLLRLLRVVREVQQMDNMGRELSVQMKRQQDVKSAQSDFSPREFMVCGRFRVDGVGMAAKDVSFPVQFTEEPSFWPGAVLEDNQSLTPNYWPEHHITVVQWYTQKNGIGNDLYKGARLLVVTRGSNDQRLWIDWNFMGVALVNPIGGTGTSDGTI